MITQLFGLPVKYESWDKENLLPIYISSIYNFKSAFIDTQKCIILTPKNELGTLPALKNHIRKIQNIDNAPIVFMLDAISAYRRKSMIENKIPFISTKQLYLPFICTFLQDEHIPEKAIEKFTFSTQQLFLLYSYSKNSEFYISTATDFLPFTAMTLSRATKQLESSGLFEIFKDGVNKVIKAKYGSRELFEKARKYLSSPIRAFGYIDKENITSDMVLSGESALSEKTMLNPPKIPTYAVYVKNFDRNKLTDELIEPGKQIRIELWEYNPKLFSKNNIADILSLALSFKGSKDERIEEAIEELLERKWDI